MVSSIPACLRTWAGPAKASTGLWGLRGEYFIKLHAFNFKDCSVH
jgi:hypothetical protein